MRFEEAESIPNGEVLKSDLCIVGAGAAGIALAREFRGAPLRLTLLEGGGLSFSHDSQRLYLADNIGLPSFHPARSRLRWYGGSTTRWSGQCRALETIDFEERADRPGSGWPFSKEDLEPYFDRAGAVCCLPPEPIAAGADALTLPEGSGLETAHFRFSFPTDFGITYRTDLEQADNVRVLLNANVVEILAAPDARRVTGVKIATRQGRRLRIEATSVVLAAGGIENARLLLASDAIAGNGLGNDNDLVGRYFMDHPYFYPGMLIPNNDRIMESAHVIRDYARVGRRQKAVTLFRLDDETLRREGLNNCGVFLVSRPHYKSCPEYFASGMRSFNHLLDVIRHDEHPDRHTLRHVGGMISGLGDVVRGLRFWGNERFRPRPVLALRAQLEPTPVRDSRVTLSARRDHLGMRRAQIDWRVDHDDLRALRLIGERLQHAAANASWGALLLDRSTDTQGWPSSMGGGKHHMGTTRMHRDPALGVVDPDCRVHGIDNLYITGSSVFPTSGYANPTLTLVALSLRLADHLRQRLAN